MCVSGTINVFPFGAWLDAIKVNAKSTKWSYVGIICIQIGCKSVGIVLIRRIAHAFQFIRRIIHMPWTRPSIRRVNMYIVYRVGLSYSIESDVVAWLLLQWPWHFSPRFFYIFEIVDFCVVWAIAWLKIWVDQFYEEKKYKFSPEQQFQKASKASACRHFCCVCNCHFGIGFFFVFRHLRLLVDQLAS